MSNGFRVKVNHLPKNLHPVAAVSGEAGPLTVQTMSNHIYFYSEIDSDRSLALLTELRYLDISLRTERTTRELSEDFPFVPIWLHINSPGGEVASAFAVVNQIQQFNKQTPVYGRAEGCCASAATLLFMACAKRYALPDTLFLIHQAKTYIYGEKTLGDIEDDQNLFRKIMNQLVAFYVTHSRGKMNEKYVKKLLERDTWLTAQEALNMGMVDVILE